LLIVRAAVGPFHSFVSVGSPIVAEGIFTFALLGCFAIRSGSGSGSKAALAPRGILAGILLLAALCFASSLSNYFLSDDYQMLDFFRRYAPTLPITWSFTQSSSEGAFFRPIASVTSSAIHAWAGESPFRWHVADLAIHLVNCALVYFVALALLANRNKAAWAAALFGVFPASPEAVAWPAGGHDTLVATLFVLATVKLYLHWLKHPRAGWMAASLCACLLALGSKEIAFALPLLLAAIAFHQRARLRTVTPFAALTAVVFVYRWYILKGAGGYGLVHATALGAAKALAARIWIILTFPVNWSVRPEIYLTLALGAGILACVALTFARPVRRDFILALAWTALFAAPAIQTLLIGADLLNARHLYLPAAGFAMLLGGALEDLPGRQWAAGATVLLFYIAALEHNLAIRARVAQAAHQSCVDVATGTSTQRPPALMDGVWMFSNGFDVCVDIEKASRSGSRPPD
jgi:hypothetical protein